MAAEAIVESELDQQIAEENYNTKLNETLIPELKTGVRLSKLFYENEKIRNFLIKKYGDRICEVMTQILMGERTYPADISKQIKKKLRKAIFS